MSLQRPRVANDVCEEHLAEAAFLWGQRKAALNSATHTLAEVSEGPEERLRAHLDGLVIGGRVAVEELLLPALEGEEETMWAPAAWALLASEADDFSDRVLAALATAEGQKTISLAEAMILSPHRFIDARLSSLWRHGEAKLRALLLDILAPRDPRWARSVLAEALNTEDEGLLAAAIRALRSTEATDPSWIWYVERHLQHTDPDVQREAVTTGVRLNLPGAWKVCRGAVAALDPEWAFYGLLAFSGDPSDVHILRKALRAPKGANAALWAHGFLGDRAAAEAALAAMSDRRLAPLAGEAFAAITGLRIEGRYRDSESTADDEQDDDAAPAPVKPADLLDRPAIEEVRRWWAKESTRFDGAARFMAGVPLDATSVRFAMGQLPTWRLAVLEIGATAREGSSVRWSPARWAHEQERALRVDPANNPQPSGPSSGAPAKRWKAMV